jgi:CelD/BcsL family acetyltransferase involved in cellulose biosynthesis
VQISVVRPSELGPAETAAWRGLQRSDAAQRSPFLSPEFAAAVGRFRPGARVAVLTEGPAVTGFFPFEKRRLGVGVPIGAGLTDCQGLVHAEGFEWDARDLLRGCGLSAFHFDHLAQEQRPFSDWVAATAPSPVIELADGFEAYHAKLMVKSPQFLKDLARRGRRLSREAGPLRHVVDSRDVAALRCLLAWKSDQYRRTGRTDRFARPWIVGLINDLFEARGSHFSGRLSVLYAGDDPVAVHFGLQSGQLLAHWFPAYDTRFSKCSPGLIQHLRMIEETVPTGITLIDMGKGAKRYKETLKTTDLFVTEGSVTGRSPLALAHRARIGPSQWAARTIRAHPPLFQAADRLLKRYGQLRTSRSAEGAPAVTPRLSYERHQNAGLQCRHW